MEVDSKKILVVDDDEILLDALSELLSRLGHQVISAKNGDKGFDLFLENKYDIVLTDYDMPGMDGITLALHIKKKSPDTRTILMTGHDKECIMDQIKNSKVDMTLFKPFDLFTIVRALQEKPTHQKQK